jgi:hypothetical protein
MLRRCSHANQHLLFAHADHFIFSFLGELGALKATGADERSSQKTYQTPTDPDERGGVAGVHSSSAAFLSSSVKRLFAAVRRAFSKSFVAISSAITSCFEHGAID